MGTYSICFEGLPRNLCLTDHIWIRKDFFSDVQGFAKGELGVSKSDLNVFDECYGYGGFSYSCEMVSIFSWMEEVSNNFSFVSNFVPTRIQKGKFHPLTCDYVRYIALFDDETACLREQLREENESDLSRWLEYQRVSSFLKIGLTHVRSSK